MATNTNDYIINGGHTGKSRLNLLSDVMYDYTKTLLERHGIAAGNSFLDVGCGGGNVAIMAAKIAGDTGRVAATDFDEEIIALARQDAIAAGLHNISFKAMGAYDIPYDSEFDIAYARFLLSHLKNPLEVLEKMKRSVKPGGRIIIEDVDFSGHFCYPPSLAFEMYVRCYARAAEHKGENANIGPALLSLFRQAGIAETGFDVIQPSFNSGAGKWMAYKTLESIRDTLIVQGMVNSASINSMLRDLDTFTKDDQTIISLPRIFRVWGVRGK